MTPDRRTLLALFSLAFGLRVLFAAVFGANPEIVPIETYDLRIATQMAGNLAWLGTPFSPNAPGYLILLAAAFTIAGTGWWTAVIMNAILGAATTLFLYRIGERRLGRYTGLAAALWLAVSVRHVIFASVAMRDVTATFFFVWLVYTLVRPFHRMRMSVWQAFLYMLLVRTEPMFLVLLPVLLIYLARWSTHHRDLSARYLVMFVTALVVFSVPWTVRNYVVHREFIPLSMEARRYTAPLDRLWRAQPPAPPVAGGEAVVHAPGFLHNTAEFWRVVRVAESPAQPEHGLRAQPAWSLRHNAINVVNYGILLPFAMTGVLIAWGRRQRAVLTMAGAVLCWSLAAGVFGGDERARLAVEPLLILIAMYGAKELYELRRAAGEHPDDRAA